MDRFWLLQLFPKEIFCFRQNYRQLNSPLNISLNILNSPLIEYLLKKVFDRLFSEFAIFCNGIMQIGCQDWIWEN